MKIGAQMYTVRDFTKNKEGIETTLKRLKEMGFDMVQVSGIGPCSAEELAAMLKENGIEACGTHSSWDRICDTAELDKLINEHKLLGCPQIGIGAKPNIYPDTYEGYSSFIKKLNEICAQVQDAGLAFGYHNHDFEFAKFNGVCAIDRMIDECPKLEFTLDVFWVQAGGANPCDYIDKLKDRIRILHLKDYRITGRERQFAEIGQGNLDWKPIFSRCIQHGIPYAVIEQDDHYLDCPFESLALSKKFLEENGYWKN
jgi:sugar phosphate isomerase/epimerase